MMERSIQPVVVRRCYYRFPGVLLLSAYLTSGFVAGAVSTAFVVAITKPTVVTHRVCAVSPDEMLTEISKLFEVGGDK